MKQAHITSLLGNPIEIHYGGQTRKLNLKKGESTVIELNSDSNQEELR